MKGATGYTGLDTTCGGISIHAPVKGATVYGAAADEHGAISIHAPVKGATSAGAGIVDLLGDFNPRSREGSDTLVAAAVKHGAQFQSTLP